MLLRLLYRLATEVSPSLLLKAGYLWVWKATGAMRAFRRRQARGDLFPPFLFLALTNACNLRCRGCWITARGGSRSLSLEQVEAIISAGKTRRCYFYVLLGGEPMLYPHLWDVIGKHRDCYFQIITNGMFFSRENVARIRTLGNVTPLVSLDGEAQQNDARRGEGVYEKVLEGIARLRQQRILFGVATTVTRANFQEVTSDRYVKQLIGRGAMYVWYYVFRPVGPDPAPELCLDRRQMIALRRRLLELRRRWPIIVIDTYWDEEGRAVCPAAAGLGFHIGPAGSVEPCPPLSFACERVSRQDGDVAAMIGRSRFLQQFQQFVHQRTRGCVILECPQQLAQFLTEQGACDYSGRNMLAELEQSQPRCSHHLPGEEIPENTRLYRFLKRQLFFGLGGYG